MSPLAKKILAGLLLLAVLGVAIWVNTIIRKKPGNLPTPVVTPEPETRTLVTTSIIGRSIEGRDIEVYSYGNGAKHLTFVGGVHGGYEWNSTLLAYKIIDYINSHLDIIPKNLTVDIIPSINPDALYSVTGKVGRFNIEDVETDKKILASARFNANSVDLNRNFDCDWKTKSTWQSKTVSAGTAPFSEPEARALRDFILKYKPAAVVFWHSKSNGVYASQCGNGILPETHTIMNLYANASKYPAIETFDAYVVTGAAEDWLAKINIPAITVELKTHETVEFDENILGSRALIEHFKQ